MLNYKQIKYLADYEEYLVNKNKRNSETVDFGYWGITALDSRIVSGTYEEEDCENIEGNEYCQYITQGMTDEQKNYYKFQKLSNDVLYGLNKTSYYELLLDVLNEYTQMQVKCDEKITKILEYIKTKLSKENERLKKFGKVEYDNMFDVCLYFCILLSNIITSSIEKENLVKFYTAEYDYENVKKKLLRHEPKIVDWTKEQKPKEFPREPFWKSLLLSAPEAGKMFYREAEKYNPKLYIVEGLYRIGKKAVLTVEDEYKHLCFLRIAYLKNALYATQLKIRVMEEL